MKYKIDIAIDICEGRPGVLIPLFKLDSSNLPYAQEMNDGFEIVDMQPYLGADNYPYQIVPLAVSTDIGERGIVCFRTFDMSIFCGHLGDVIEHYNSNRGDIGDYLMLDLQLARICGEPLGVLIDKSRKLDDIITPSSSRRRWSDGELILYQKNKTIWNNINNKIIKEEESIVTDLSSHSFEYLFRWLVSNNSSKHWARVWLRAVRLSPFDERLPIVARDWIIGKFLSDDDFYEIRPVLFLYLESMTIRQDSDFSDALTEYVLEKSERYHQFLLPANLPTLILFELDIEMEPAKALYFVEYLIERLVGDSRYMNTLEIAQDYLYSIREYINRVSSDDEYVSKHSSTILNELKERNRKT